MPYFLNNNRYIPVSAEFIKEKLPQANPTFVKVYIYLLMLASEGAQLPYSEIADKLGLLESDLMQAINYWQEKGELKKEADAVYFGGRVSFPELSADAPRQESYSNPQTEPQPHRVENISEIISGNKELSDMFMLAQEILGKTITERDMETIYWFYSDLGMTPEVILLLLEYCVSKGKNRMSYIETVAVSWNERGLNTSERVAEYLKEEEQKTGFIYSIRKIMGISDRSLSQIEEKYLIKWHDEFGMSEEMIALAYEHCIIQTAKLSFPYMDKIITRWYNEGISTIAAAEEDNKKFRSRIRNGGANFDKTGYEQEDLESLTRNS